MHTGVVCVYGLLVWSSDREEDGAGVSSAVVRHYLAEWKFRICILHHHHEHHQHHHQQHHRFPGHSMAVNTWWLILQDPSSWLGAVCIRPLSYGYVGLRFCEPLCLSFSLWPHHPPRKCSSIAYAATTTPHFQSIRCVRGGISRSRVCVCVWHKWRGEALPKTTDPAVCVRPSWSKNGFTTTHPPKPLESACLVRICMFTRIAPFP